MQAPSPISRFKLELSFTFFIALFGAYIIIGAMEMEYSWGKPGYFPFRVGVLIEICAFLIVLQTLKTKASLAPFEINVKNIAKFFVPLVVLVATIPLLGLYIGAFLYLLYMLKTAKFTWLKSLAFSIITPLLLFFAFEKIFKTPLPKGILSLVGIQ